MKIYKHILVATDLTAENNLVIDKARDLASKYGAKISLVHSIEHLPSYAYGYPGIAGIETELTAAAQESMTKLGEMADVPKSDQIISLGMPKKCILGTADERGVDLILVGSHGRHGLQRILGSTAASILNSAKCDVLVVKYDV